MRQDIAVEVGDHPEGGGKKVAVVTDRTPGRAWSGEGETYTEAATAATRKFLGDRHSREYVE